MRAAILTNGDLGASDQYKPSTDSHRSCRLLCVHNTLTLSSSYTFQDVLSFANEDTGPISPVINHWRNAWALSAIDD